WAERWLDLVELHIGRGADWYQNQFTLLQMLLWAPPGRWLPLGAVSPVRGTSSPPAASLAPGTRSFPVAVAEPVTQRVRTLEFLGILEAAEGPDFSVSAVRLTPVGRTYLDAVFGNAEACLAGLLPEDERSFIVAPNFEVVAPFTLQPSTLLELGALADLVKADQALVFQISRASVYRALKGGMDGETVLAVLEKGGQHPLPQNVQASIREWAAAYGRVWLARFHLLRCADAETAARLKVLPRLQPYVAGELTPRDLILREGDYTAVYEILEREGFLPRAQIELAPPLDGEAPPAPDQTGMASPVTAATRRRVACRRTPAGSPGRRRHDEISPGRAPSRPPIRVVPSDWFDLPGRR
ncbi:MAG: helicase-associated domain-containing protein, partial [Bacillota bacterium]